MGFKRRGMLVNHLAKRHPEIKPEQVPELNLPILKTQKDFYCQYCDKVGVYENGEWLNRLVCGEMKGKKKIKTNNTRSNNL